VQPVILDVDPGVDDALAIILALRSPELDVVGISTVCGNVPVEQGTTNALRVLELMQRPDVPVFVGAGRPLKCDPIHAGYVHGASGIGEAELPAPRISARGDAVGFLIDCISSHPGEVTVIALGPLTNLALAEARRPGILSRARSVMVMGGALFEPGNVSPVAEFNFFVDPHAARQVLRLAANLALVPLDVTRKAVLMEESTRDAALGKDPVALFCKAAARTAIDHSERSTGVRGMCLHDPLVVGLVCQPRLCSMVTSWIEIETEGELTRGQVVVDRRGISSPDLSGRPVECATELEAGRFMEMFLQRVLGLS
jgi:purine nucleosidase